MLFRSKAGVGKVAAVTTLKRSSRRFQEEVTSSGSSDVGPPPGFQGPPQYNGMQEKGNKGKGKSEVIHCMNLLQVLFCVSELV